MSGSRPPRLPTAPLIVNWSLSYRCNFQCRHCYSRDDRSVELSTEQVVEAGAILAGAGVLMVNFGGGEPLLRRDLFTIARALVGGGLSLSMNSNGWLLDAAAAASLRESGFSSVGLSLDSHLPERHDHFRSRPGSHGRLLKAAGHLRRAGMPLTISSVLSRLNHQELEPLLRLGGELGATRIFLHNFKCSGRGFENRRELDLNPGEWKECYGRALSLAESGGYPELSFDDPILAALGAGARQSEGKGSSCGKLSLHLRPDGDFTPCGFIPLSLGNIFRDDFRQLWRQSAVLQAMRQKTAEGKCRGCGHYGECLGGCTARAFAMTGNLNAPDPHCWVGEEGEAP